MEEIKDFRNDLLKRREVSFYLDCDSNPGFKIALKKLADKFKVAEDLVLVRNVYSNFGRHTFLIEGFIYDTKEDMEKIEGKVAKSDDKNEGASEEVKVEVAEKKDEDKKETADVKSDDGGKDVSSVQ